MAGQPGHLVRATPRPGPIRQAHRRTHRPGPTRLLARRTPQPGPILRCRRPILLLGRPPTKRKPPATPWQAERLWLPAEPAPVATKLVMSAIMPAPCNIMASARLRPAATL